MIIKHIRIWCIAGVCAVFASCTTYIPTDYAGWSEKRVISELGVPDKTYKLQDATYLEYTREEHYRTSVQQNCTSNSTANDKHHHTNCTSYGGNDITDRCVLTIVIEHSRVSNYKRRGSETVCRQLEGWKAQAS